MALQELPQNAGYSMVISLYESRHLNGCLFFFMPCPKIYSNRKNYSNVLISTSLLTIA